MNDGNDFVMYDNKKDRLMVFVDHYIGHTWFSVGEKCLSEYKTIKKSDDLNVVDFDAMGLTMIGYF